MKTAFLSESNFQGKVPLNHLNMRTELAWQAALQSDHFNIHDYAKVSGYDVVFIIFPKATVKLNTVGIEMTTPGVDKDIGIYSHDIVKCLKTNNQLVCAVQEGPAWFFNEYDLVNQFNFYNQLAECDIIFAHNEYDTHFYKGLFPQTRIKVIPTLMIVNNDTCPFVAAPENKAIIGGNFARWYGGFQSYLVATEFQCPIYVPASHCKRKGEEQVPHLNHLPWVFWTKWMEQLSTFKYAVNLMPTIAAGTFSLNCAYYGIPCVGNEKVDTQLAFFPDLSVDVHDVFQARHQAILLLNKDYYEGASHHAKKTFKDSPHGNVDKWMEIMKDAIYG